MDKVKEQKREYVEKYLAPALIEMGAGIMAVEYTVDGNDPDGMFSEAVVVTFEHGGTRTANVSWDSCLAIFKDVAKQIVEEL